jgi:hypothetical protein
MLPVGKSVPYPYLTRTPPVPPPYPGRTSGIGDSFKIAGNNKKNVIKSERKYLKREDAKDTKSYPF